MRLSAKPIKEILKSEIEADKKLLSHSFFLYSDRDNRDSFYYLKGIKRVLTEFNLPFEEDFIDKSDVASSLNNFSKKASSSYTILARPLGVKEEEAFIDKINPKFDPDMMTSYNLGKLLKGDIDYLPATIQSVKRFIKYYSLNIASKKALIIGRSLTVGLPLSLLLNKLNATITIAHSKTERSYLKSLLKECDILALASGKDNIVTASDLRSGETVIDCGYHDGHGDLAFSPSDDVTFTPVPDGIGALTSYCLLLNAITLAKN